MILQELTAVPSGQFPVQAFSDHIHLGTGLADDGSQNAVLEGYLRAAIAAVEARTGKALFQRRFSWGVYAWISDVAQGVPISPVQTIESVRLTSSAGVDTVIDPSTYRLERDTHAPKLVAARGHLPRIGAGASVEVILEAGFGPDWSDIPSDLQQAVLMLAANYYDHRHGTGHGDDAIPFSVLALLEPYRKIRISGVRG